MKEYETTIEGKAKLRVHAVGDEIHYTHNAGGEVVTSRPKV
jgi:hypothetical protein